MSPAAATAVTLTHRRIALRPNRPGAAFTLVLLGQWLAAYNYNNNLAYLLAYLLAGVALVATLHAYRNLAGLEICLVPPAPGFAGDRAVWRLELRNPTGQPRRALTVGLGAAPRWPWKWRRAPPGSRP